MGESSGNSDRVVDHVSDPEWGPEYTGVLRMMDQAADRPDHDAVLARLEGVWAQTGLWQIRTDRPAVPLGGRVENRWILFGRFLESDTFPTVDATTPSSKVIYGYDPREEDYFAFAVSALNRHYDIEHGPYDAATDALLLRGSEIVLPGRREIRFLRTIAFTGPDTAEVSISYPEEEDRENFGGLTATWTRMAQGGPG